MRVLWLDDDRSMRVCDFFTPLREALAKLCDLEFILCPLPKLEGAFCRDCCNGHAPPRMVDPEYANTFDWIITPAMWAFMGEEWSAIKAKKAIIVGDCHGDMVATYVRFALDAGFDLFLPVYRQGFKDFCSYIPEHMVRWLPYWVDASYLHDYGREKTIGCLSTGVLHANIYPVRTALYEAVKRMPWVMRVERPAENMDGKYWPVGADYGRLINSAWTAIACTSRFRYSLSKPFEIMASWSALICDHIPEFDDLGLRPGVNYLQPDMTKPILEQVQGWLAEDNRDELRAITNAGYELMHSRHTTADRADQLRCVFADRA